VVGVSGHSLLQAYGLLYTSAIDTGWIIAICPICITLAARLILRERITSRKMVGILLGFAGVFLVISKGKMSASLFRLGTTFGDLLILTSALTWTAFTVGGRGFVSKFPPLATIAPITLLGFVAVLPFSSGPRAWGLFFCMSPSTWASILFLGIFCSGLAYLFWYAALESRDATTIGTYLYLEPFVTLIGALIFLDERVEWLSLIGGLITLIGVYLTTRNHGLPAGDKKS
jgi:drug/metabolite transporter (DMT)-like permease